MAAYDRFYCIGQDKLNSGAAIENISYPFVKTFVWRVQLCLIEMALLVIFNLCYG